MNKLKALLFASVLFIVGSSFADDSINAVSVKNDKNVPRITLNNGVKIPQLGLGTFALNNNGEAYNSVLSALKAGYRHIDTAHAYQNETSVGKAIKDSGVPREEIWVTSKLWPTEYADKKALDKMLDRLGLEYLDLVYIHQPIGEYMTAWKYLVQAQKDGKVCAIGISNFDRSEELFDSFMAQVEVKPQMMQLECHPFAQRVYWQKKLKKHNIQQENWFPLGGRWSGGSIFKNETIQSIAKTKGKSPVQIIIRWHIQEGFCVIPGSSNPAHIQENIDVFDFTLTDEEMAAIRAINKERLFFVTTMENMKSYLRRGL